MSDDDLRVQCARILLGAEKRRAWITPDQAKILARAMESLRAVSERTTCETHKQTIDRLQNQVRSLKEQLMSSLANARTMDLGPDITPDEPGIPEIVDSPLHNNDERRRLVARLEELRARNRRLNLAVHHLYSLSRQRPRPARGEPGGAAS